MADRFLDLFDCQAVCLIVGLVMPVTLNVIPRRAGNELEIIVLASAMRSYFFTGSTLDRCEPPDVCDSV